MNRLNRMLVLAEAIIARDMHEPSVSVWDDGNTIVIEAESQGRKMRFVDRRY